MDNSQASQINNLSTQPFFTDGAGRPISQEKSHQAKDDLNYVNLSMETVGRHPRNIANIAMHHKEDSQDSEKDLQYGNIININESVNSAKEADLNSVEMQGVERTISKDHFPVEEKGQIIDINTYRAEKDKIDPGTLKGVVGIVNRFKNGKISPAELDDVVWEGTKAYVRNSFERELTA